MKCGTWALTWDTMVYALKRIGGPGDEASGKYMYILMLFPPLPPPFSTPLIRLGRLSEETGCTIAVKAENLNPGGSVKDRAALYLIKDAEEKGIRTTAVR